MLELFKGAYMYFFLTFPNQLNPYFPLKLLYISSIFALCLHFDAQIEHALSFHANCNMYAKQMWPKMQVAQKYSKCLINMWYKLGLSFDVDQFDFSHSYFDLFDVDNFDVDNFDIDQFNDDPFFVDQFKVDQFDLSQFDFC